MYELFVPYKIKRVVFCIAMISSLSTLYSYHIPDIFNLFCFFFFVDVVMNQKGLVLAKGVGLVVTKLVCRIRMCIGVEYKVGLVVKGEKGRDRSWVRILTLTKTNN